MPYRDDLVALAARRAALEHDVVTTSRELVETSRLLDEATARSRLPVLDNIRIASPCKARWSAMTGDERKRECADCNKTVFNLSALTRAEAEALVVEHAGNLCARYYQRADGTILLADCTITTGARRRQFVLAAGATALLAGTIASAVAATSSDPIPVGDVIDSNRETIQPRGATSVAEDPPPATPREVIQPDVRFELPPTEEIIRVEGAVPIIDETSVVMGAVVTNTYVVEELPPPPIVPAK